MQKIPFFLVYVFITCFQFISNAQAPGYNTEPHRPQFHFSPEKHWMNDPNGMVYFKGEYHLFYQYFPDSTVWGPMHWGHAVSKDLVHWNHLPIALYPDSLGLIFSGSAVVDWKNTSGFGKNGEPPMVAMFTHHLMDGEKAGRNDFQYQSLAYSNDRGRTWTKYAGNPVIPNPGIKDFRDTKVFWHAPSQHWVVVLAAADQVFFYHSPDLKHWTKTGSFGLGQGNHGGVWECPDLFPLSVSGSKEEKWVLIQSIGTGAPNGGSGTQYFVGDFDGKTFVNSNPADQVLWLDYGRDNYAGVSWSNAPDGRRLFIGWMSNWAYAQQVPTSPWRSAMTVVRELSLQKTLAGLRMINAPVKELAQLRNSSWPIKEQPLAGTKILAKNTAQHELELAFDLDKTTAAEFGVRLANKLGEEVLIGYETNTQRFFVDRSKAGKTDFSSNFAGRHYAPRSSKNSVLQWHQLTDVSSLELFADDGAECLTELFFPTEKFTQVSLYAKGGNVALKRGKLYSLNSIW